MTGLKTGMGTVSLLLYHVYHLPVCVCFKMSIKGVWTLLVEKCHKVTFWLLGVGRDGGCDNCDENWLSCFSTISTLFLFFSGFWNLNVYKILCKISLRKSNTQVVFAPLETYILPIVYEWLQGKSLSWHTIECTTEVPGSDFLRFVDASRSFWTHVLKISYDSSMMLGNFQT